MWGGYLGQNSAYEFFGIGEATAIDYLKITWLSGAVDLIINPAINDHHTIVEGTFLATEDINNVLDKITIFPNPGSLLTIKYPESIDSHFLSVVDVTGRNVLTKREVFSLERIDFTDYSDGIYFFIFENEKDKLAKKVIVN